MRRFLGGLVVLIASAALVSGGIGLAVAAVTGDYLPEPQPERAGDSNGPPSGQTPSAAQSPVPASSRSSEVPSGEPTSTPSPKSFSPVQVADARAYDPFGDGHEHDEAVSLATDDNPATGWRTEHYSTADLGGLKPGVGLLVDLGRPRTVRAVHLRLLVGGGSTVQLRAGNSANSIEHLSVVATFRDADSTVTARFEQPTKARYWLVWFTQLPAYDDNYRGGVSEISFTAAAKSK